MKTADLTIASYILLDCYPEPVTLERVACRTGFHWAIRQIGWCFSKRGRWEYEPQPSSRTETFFARCRWKSAQDALNDWVRLKGASRLACPVG